MTSTVKVTIDGKPMGGRKRFLLVDNKGKKMRPHKKDALKTPKDGGTWDKTYQRAERLITMIVRRCSPKTYISLETKAYISVRNCR